MEKVSSDKKVPLVFMGNRHKNTLDVSNERGKTLRERYTIGEPNDCPAGKAVEMKRRGYVGIYLHEDKVVKKFYHLR